MSRSPTISTVRGTKKEMQQRLVALRGQHGEHGIAFEPITKEARGSWRLRFWFTPEREKIRQINRKLKGETAGLELPESAREILGAIFAGAELISFRWAGQPAWRLSSKHTREKAADVALLRHHGLIAVTSNKLTSAGMQLVLRRLGGANA